MLCARVMRGISSRAKKETPAFGQVERFFERAQRLAQADQDLAGTQARQDLRGRLRDSRPGCGTG